MTRTALRLTVSKALKIYRGEESRTLSFFLLHVLLSLLIGMISTVVDPLFIKHSSGGASFLLYGLSAVLLGSLGILYAGITDRYDKRKVFTMVLYISFGVCFAGSVLLLLQDFVVEIPFLFPGLFIWRFIIGIILLMVFWDLAPFYFDARQGKRLFPLLAMGGAVGYSGGSFIVAPLALIFPFGVQLFIIALLTLFCAAGFRYIRRTYPILDSPRYREKSVASEVKEGFRVFRANSFLRAVGWNTIIFGLFSGLIIFTYNSVVNARSATGADAAGFMGLQRAGATILQAVVLTKVMSQSVLGGRHKKELATKIFFFILGIAAFAVSMVGVADFTRQIEIALMSPAAMAAFAFLPSRYRGRVMVLNNLVVAPLGILLASIFVFALSSFVNPLWFIYPIGALMAARLVFNFILNRRYMALLSESLLSESRLNLARIEENTGSILRNEDLLRRLHGEMDKQSMSVRVFVIGRLAKSAETFEDINRLEPFFMDPSESLQALWIGTLARIQYDRYEMEIRNGMESPFREVRTVSRLAVLRYLQKTGKTEEFSAIIGEFREKFETALSTGSSEEFEEALELLLRLELETGKSIIEPDWAAMGDEKKRIFLRALGRNPNAHYFPLLVDKLQDETYRSLAVAGLKKMDEALLLNNKGIWADFSFREKLCLLREFKDSHRVFTRDESSDLVRAMIRRENGSDKEPEGTLEVLHRRGRDLIEAALLVLSDTAPIPGDLSGLAEEEKERFTSLYPYLFLLMLNSSGQGEKAYPLLQKMVNEQLKDLSLLVLCLSSLGFAKVEDRVFAGSICRELGDRTAIAQQNALEFIETKIAGPAKMFLLLYFENLTPEEKRIRLKPLLKNTPLNYKRGIALWHGYFSRAEDKIAEEIFASFKEE
jgi:MFS family permease